MTKIYKCVTRQGTIILCASFRKLSYCKRLTDSSVIPIYCADSDITIGSDPIIIWQLVLQAILRVHLLKVKLVYMYPIDLTSRHWVSSSFGVKKVEQRSFKPQWFAKWPFPHYDEAKDAVFCHTCIEACKLKRATARQPEPVFVSTCITFFHAHECNIHVVKH